MEKCDFFKDLQRTILLCFGSRITGQKYMDNGGLGHFHLFSKKINNFRLFEYDCRLGIVQAWYFSAVKEL